jgi:hypothetical protein
MTHCSGFSTTSVISWTGFQYIPEPEKPETKKGSCYVLAKVILAPRTLQNGEAGHSRDYLFDGMVPEKTGITEPEFESSQDSESRGTDLWPACPAKDAAGAAQAARLNLSSTGWLYERAEILKDCRLLGIE